MEVIGTIVSAEEKAQETVKNASARAREVVLAAQKQCEQLEADKLAAAKAEAEKILAAAEEEAQVLYAEKTAQNEQEYTALVAAAKANIDSAAKYVVGRIK